MANRMGEERGTYRALIQETGGPFLAIAFVTHVKGKMTKEGSLDQRSSHNKCPLHSRRRKKKKTSPHGLCSNV